MKNIVYFKHGKELPYVSEEREIITLPKGRSKILTIQYSNGKEVKYEMMMAVGQTRSQTFRTFDFATLESVHKENAKSYEYLFKFNDCFRVGCKVVPAVVAQFMSFKEWCDFHEDTGL